MFSKSDLSSLKQFRSDYSILVSNCHDITLHSLISGHDWIIISGYDRETCRIMDRHSHRDPFHHQRGIYDSLASAMKYIQGHDRWFTTKEQG